MEYVLIYEYVVSQEENKKLKEKEKEVVAKYFAEKAEIEREKKKLKESYDRKMMDMEKLVIIFFS